MKKALLSAMKDRSPIQRPWRAPVRWILLQRVLPSLSASGEKLRAAAFAKRLVRSCSEMGPCGFGISPTISFQRLPQIVDRFHAKQYLSNVGKALYGLTTPRASQWAERRKEELDSGRFRLSGPGPPPPGSSLRRGSSLSPLFPRPTARRMRYPEFHCPRSVYFHWRCRGRIARWPSARASNAPGCTGLSKAPTPSLLSAAQNSVAAFRISGSADQNAGPRDPSLSWGAPPNARVIRRS